MNISKTNRPIWRQIGMYIENEYSDVARKGYAVHIATFLDTIDYWGKHNKRLRDKKFRHHGYDDWAFFRFRQFQEDLGCGREKANNIIKFCLRAGIIQKATFGINNKMHFRIVPERLLALINKCEIEEKISRQAMCGYELAVALPDWLDEPELFWSLLQNRKVAGLPVHKGIQQNLLRELERIKNKTIDGAKKAIEVLRYAVSNGLNWVRRLERPAINSMDYVLAVVRNNLLKTFNKLGLTESLEKAFASAKQSLERKERQDIKKAQPCGWAIV